MPSQPIYDAWAESVRLDQNVRDNLPVELQNLVAASYRLPGWNSDLYRPYKSFRSVVKTLARYAAAAIGTPDGPMSLSNEDNDLTADLAEALLPILSLIKHVWFIESRLQSAIGGPSEADWRTPLDQLANISWFYQDVPDFSHVLECKLQLPKAGNVPDTRCHSAIYFGVPRLDHFVALPPPAQRACSSLVTAGKHVIHVLHWATEYATTGTRAERWVMMDIVSGLYQRRALGFPSHFVFGSAHSERSLRVFAGRWTLKQRNPASKAGVGCVDKQGISQDAAVATESGSVGVDQAQQTEDEYEISIYEVGQYELNVPLQAVELYLLMRASRTLALTYIAEIGSEETNARLPFVLNRLPFDWPAPPRPESSTRSFTSSIKQEEAISTIIDGCDLAMESASTNSLYLSGDPVQEAEWEDEWRASYEEAIEKLGRGEPVQFNSLKRKICPSSEDRVLESIGGSVRDDTSA